MVRWYSNHFISFCILAPVILIIIQIVFLMNLSVKVKEKHVDDKVWMSVVWLQPVVVQLQLCPTLYGPVDCSTPGFPALHRLPEFAQVRVHWVDDAIRPSHPPLSPSPAFSLSQHQGLFQWVAKVLELQLQNSAEINQKGWFPLGLTGLISLLSKGLYHQESSPAPQFKSINSLVLSCLYSPPPTTVHDYCKNHSFD